MFSEETIVKENNSFSVVWLEGTGFWLFGWQKKLFCEKKKTGENHCLMLNEREREKWCWNM